MDESGKQLGAVVIAVVVVLALIAMARVIIPKLQTKVENELDKVTSTTTGAITFNNGDNEFALADGTVVSFRG